jgi:predicted negative regulator of RcsB-dependent stress response
MANDPQQFRVQDDRFDGSPAAPVAPRKKSAVSTCLTGCLIVFIVMLVLGVIAAWWIWNNAASLAASAGSTVAKEAINQTDLPQAEKDEIFVQIDRLADAGREGKLTLQQLSTFFQEFSRSPLMTTLAMSMVDKKYIEPSGLNDEEKAEARVTVQRFMRGAIDEKISQADVKKAMAPVSTEKPDGNLELKESVTDDELKAFLATAKAEADAAEIPAQVEAVDPSDEFKRLVDQTLGAADADLPVDEPAAGAAEPAELEGEPALN